MKNIVITGSTRGIGYWLADSFLNLGCSVVINGKSQTSVDYALDKLRKNHDANNIFGHPCDVSSFTDLQSLWAAASKQFDKIDVWINNAGLGNLYRPAWKQPPEQIETIIKTNIVGVMYGTHIAFNEMCKQGFGQIFNIEGLGGDGRMVKGTTIYASSKSGMTYFTRSMANEIDNEPVQIGLLHPGMVITDLFLDSYENPADLDKFKGIFNIIASRPEDVTPWLAKKVLANKKNGARIKWMTFLRTLGRFLSAPFCKRDFFSD